MKRIVARIIYGVSSQGDPRNRDRVKVRPYSWHEQDIDSALKKRSASFDLWCVVFYGSEPATCPTSADQEKYKHVLQRIFRAFEMEHGHVIKMYFCRNFLCAVALTKKRFTAKLHILFNILDAAQGDSESVELARIMYECRSLTLSVNENLQGRDLEICLDQIYWVVGEVGARLDESLVASESRHIRIGWNSKEGEELREAWRGQLEDAKSFYLRSSKRTAETKYLTGMIYGLLFLLGLGSFLGYVVQHFLHDGIQLRFLVGSYLGGAFGAMVSVMTRLTKGTLKLNFESGKWALRVLGLVRPVLGSIFGLFLYFVLAGGVVHVVASKGKASELFFYTAVAFVAGFSERFAQDMLRQVSANVIHLSSDESEMSGEE